MRKLVTVLASVAMVVALGAPAYAAESGRSATSTGHYTTLDHHGDRHGDWHHGDRDDYYRHHDGYYRDGYYRHHYRDGYYDGYPYYYDGYYDGYDGRCRWAYYHDRYWFDRYCGGYYGYY